MIEKKRERERSDPKIDDYTANKMTIHLSVLGFFHSDYYQKLN